MSAVYADVVMWPMIAGLWPFLLAAVAAVVLVVRAVRRLRKK